MIGIELLTCFSNCILGKCTIVIRALPSIVGLPFLAVKFFTKQEMENSQ